MLTGGTNHAKNVQHHPFSAYHPVILMKTPLFLLSILTLGAGLLGAQALAGGRRQFVHHVLRLDDRGISRVSKRQVQA